MAVIVRKTIKVAGAEAEVKAFRAGGALSKGERESAERLDEALSDRIPVLAEELKRESVVRESTVQRWYRLGRKLREIVDDRTLVSTSDVDSGAIWAAIWHFLPASLKPSHSSLRDYEDKKHKRKDHLSLCFDISEFAWEDVEWIKRWDDWNQLEFRPGLLRDRRVLELLGREISAQARYPNREEFRAIVKILADEFPTRKMRDSSVLPDEEIRKRVAAAVYRSMTTGDA